jgi:tetratricopeptide (TPR) repeat protein
MLAEQPYLEGRWADAETAYRAYLEANPSNSFAWNRLGTSQVQQKKYGEAVTSLERAIATGGGAAVDFYNLACAYALSGAPEKALDNVERAIGAGLKRREQYEADPDLASLRELPRFKALMQSL